MESFLQHQKILIFADESLKAGTSYTYTLKTVDHRGNTSKGVTVDVTTITHSERISGTDRYKTATAFVDKEQPHSLDSVIITSGQNYPDALAGGVLNKQSEWHGFASPR